MRARLAFLLPALCFGLGGCVAAEAPPAESVPYVPAHVWSSADDAHFYERWFGDQLRAMGEPSLSQPGALGRFRSRFRMLVLPTFHPAYAIRVDETAVGEGKVRAVRLDGAGGYDPGVIAQQESYTLGREEMRHLERAIRQSGLAVLSPELEREAASEILICADGVRFVFELVDPQGSRFVSRHRCELSGELPDLIARVDDLRRSVGSDLGEYGALRR